MPDDVLKETIDNLKASGISDNEVIDLLKSMGYDEGSIKSAMGPNSVNSLETKHGEKDVEDDSDDDEDISVDSIARQEEVDIDLKNEANKAVLASNLAINVTEAAVNKVKENTKEVNNLKDNINDLRGRIDSLPSIDHVESINRAAKELHGTTCDIDSKVDDLIAKTNVLTSIMKQILDSQRDILLKLQK